MLSLLRFASTSKDGAAKLFRMTQLQNVKNGKIGLSHYPPYHGSFYEEASKYSTHLIGFLIPDFLYINWG